MVRWEQWITPLNENPEQRPFLTGNYASPVMCFFQRIKIVISKYFGPSKVQLEEIQK